MHPKSTRLIIIISAGILLVAAAAILLPRLLGSAGAGQSSQNATKMAAQVKITLTAQVFAVKTVVAQMNATQTAKAPKPTPKPSPSPEPPDMSTKTSPKDGAVMVYIHSGEFLMGASDSDINAAERPEEKPQRKIYLDGFWMDKMLVTNAMYDACVQANGCGDRVHDGKKLNPHYHDPAYAYHPAIYVNWFDAVNYCKWVGRRLPTEAEWEKSARGTDGRIYPWGNDPPNALLANFDNPSGYTAVVGSYPMGASPYGLMDITGNVREWMSDWFDENYLKNAPDRNPQGPESGTERSLRGASWGDGKDFLRTTARNKHLPTSPGDPRGFRCASSQ